MSFLLDTNILLRFAKTSGPQHPVVRKAIVKLRLASETINITPQNIIEFWSVATRPAKNNGLGLSISETKKEIRKFKRLFRLVDDSPLVFRTWELLVDKYNVQGKTVHDTRFVALMIEYGISHLLTFNTQDFIRFQEITVVEPGDLL